MPIKKYEKKKNNKTKKKLKINPKVKKTIKISLIAIFLIILVAIGVFCGKVYGVIKDAKLGIDNFIIKNENSVVKDINGITIAKLSGDENREIIAISEMSPYLPKAFVSIEDERFYEHSRSRYKKNHCCNCKICIK